jgi:hypothetical protein
MKDCAVFLPDFPMHINGLVHKAFTSALPPEQVLDLTQPQPLGTILTALETEQVRYVFGNLHYGMHTRLNFGARRIAYAVFLRDPVFREADYYYTRRRISALSGQPEPVDDYPSLAAWLRTEDRAHNVQTRTLLRHVDNMGTSDPPLNSTPLFMFRYAFVGCIERLEESLELMAWQFDLPLETSAIERYEEPTLVEQYATLRDIIREEDPYDFALYEQARIQLRVRLETRRRNERSPSSPDSADLRPQDMVPLLNDQHRQIWQRIANLKSRLDMLTGDKQ